MCAFGSTGSTKRQDSVSKKLFKEHIDHLADYDILLLTAPQPPLLHLRHGLLNRRLEQLLRCQYLYFCTRKASKLSAWSATGAPPYTAHPDTPPCLKKCFACWNTCTLGRQHTSAFVSIRLHMSACVSIRRHTPNRIRQHMSAYVSIRRHTSAYA